MIILSKDTTRLSEEMEGTWDVWKRPTFVEKCKFYMGQGITSARMTEKEDEEE